MSVFLLLVVCLSGRNDEVLSGTDSEDNSEEVW